MSDFQRHATQQGRSFEDLVEFMLQAAGWEVIDRHITVEGAEIDFHARDPHGVQWWIECKGSFRGRTPGSQRGDTVKKAVAVAWYLSTLPDRKPYRLITSHLPNAGTLGERMLNRAADLGLFDAIDAVGFISMADEGEND